MAVGDSVALGTGANTGNALASFTFTTANAAPAGAFLVVSVGWFKAAANTITLAGGGLTWAMDKAVANGSDRVNQFSAQAPAGLASGTVLTFSVTGTGADGPIFGGQAYTGVATASPVDVSSSATPAAGTAWNAGTLTPTVTDDLVVVTAWGDGAATSSTPGGVYGEMFDVNNATNVATLTQTRLLGATTAAESPTGTWLASVTNAAVAVAYKAAAVAAVPKLIMAPYQGAF